jgi:hypothetical protein
MMKKFLILMLVLGLTSLASANLVGLQISVNGMMVEDPPVINLQPSQTATLDIFTDIGIPAMSSRDMVLIVDTGCGLITGGVALKPNASAGLVVYTAQENAYYVPEGQDGGLFSMASYGDAIPGMTKLFDYITFHCESLNGPTVITLAELDEEGSYTGAIYDTVTINQIPEPATIALLGLGGLLLRRRK